MTLHLEAAERECEVYENGKKAGTYTNSTRATRRVTHKLDFSKHDQRGVIEVKTYSGAGRARKLYGHYSIAFRRGKAVVYRAHGTDFSIMMNFQRGVAARAQYSYRIEGEYWVYTFQRESGGALRAPGKLIRWRTDIAASAELHAHPEYGEAFATIANVVVPWRNARIAKPKRQFRRRGPYIGESRLPGGVTHVDAVVPAKDVWYTPGTGRIRFQLVGAAISTSGGTPCTVEKAVAKLP